VALHDSLDWVVVRERSEESFVVSVPREVTNEASVSRSFGWTSGVAAATTTAAAAAATFSSKFDATNHLLSTILALLVIVDPDKLHRVARVQRVAVGDSRRVTEEIIPPIFRPVLVWLSVWWLR
jgi:hypothetical protein